MTFEITITRNEAGVKPKNFLKKKLNVNYNQLIKAIKNKRITLNKKKIKEDDTLQENDIIKVWDEKITLRDNSTKQLDKKDIENLHLKILHKTEDFLILDKKPGVVVQGAYDNDLSLSKHLRYLEFENHLDAHSLFHVHRLDKDTSGCLVIGNGKVNIRELNTLFQKKNITKIYSAICAGHFKEKEKTIELDMSKNDEGKLPKVIVKKGGKPTKLKYKVIKEFEIEHQRLSLVEIELITGFMHQIRVTMHHLNHSIVGDKMYSNLRVNEQFSKDIKRQLLHASNVKFTYNGEKVDVKSQYPKDFKILLH